MTTGIHPVSSASSAGAKAESLQWLEDQDFAVPSWSVLPAEGLEQFLAAHQLKWPESAEGNDLAAFQEAIKSLPMPKSLEQQLRQIATPLLELGAIAARSSCTLEDLAEASFAGQYESYLSLTTFDEVQQAVRNIWASAATQRVTQYLQQQGLSAQSLRMAVIFQQMVPATAAGVVFTLNPLTGRDEEIVIELCAGLGEALVSGQVTPDRYRYEWQRGHWLEALAENKSLLPLSALEELAQLCLQAQSSYGCPVDVEWAFDGKQFWFLQVRPITAHGVSGYVGEWTTADMKDGGVSSSVCTPMMASLYEVIFAKATPEYFDSVGITASTSEQEPWYMVAYGRPYWNVGHVKARLRQLPGFSEGGFNLDLGIASPPGFVDQVTKITPRTAIRGLRVLSEMKRSFRRRVEQNMAIVPELERILGHREQQVPEEWTESELISELAQLLGDEFVRCETAYFQTIYDNSNAQSLFQEKLVAAVGAERASVVSLALLGGLDNVSHLRPVHEERSLVREFTERPEDVRRFLAEPVNTWVKAYQQGEPFPGDDLLRPYLQRWGFLAPRTLELLQARWWEDPTPLFESIHAGLRHLAESETDSTAQGTTAAWDHESTRRSQEAFSAAREEVLAQLRSWIPGRSGTRRRTFQQSLTCTRELLWWREEMRMYSTRMYAQIRRFLLAYGSRLQQDNHLERAEDIFFFDYAMLLAILRGERKLEDGIGELPWRYAYYQGYREYQIADEIGAAWSGGKQATHQPVAMEGSQWKGIACSSGCYEGPARVIHRVEDVGRLVPGDVLITRFTDPGWTTAFLHLGAVVTETGGVLSHAAVIAREYGFPAVLAVPQVTAFLQDGDLVRVDGSRGVVERLKPAT